MEITTTTINRNPGRRAAVNALAFVGFIALLIIGIILAIYSARYLPRLSSRLGGAAVSLSSVFHKNDTAQLQVVTATTTLPIEDATTPAETTSTTTTTVETTPTKKPVSTTPGQTTYTTITTTTGPAELYGKSDLTVKITAVGYLTRSGDTDTFVESSSIPSGKNGAVKFTVTNAGTNTTGSWKFEASVPTSPSQTFTSPTQNSLAPGDSIDYVLGFEKGKKGNDRDIIVTVDPKDSIDESNEGNNEDAQAVDILS